MRNPFFRKGTIVFFKNFEWTGDKEKSGAISAGLVEGYYWTRKSYGIIERLENFTYCEGTPAIQYWIRWRDGEYSGIVLPDKRVSVCYILSLILYFFLSLNLKKGICSEILS